MNNSIDRIIADLQFLQVHVNDNKTDNYIKEIALIDGKNFSLYERIDMEKYNTSTREKIQYSGQQINGLPAFEHTKPRYAIAYEKIDNFLIRSSFAANSDKPLVIYVFGHNKKIAFDEYLENKKLSEKFNVVNVERFVETDVSLKNMSTFITQICDVDNKKHSEYCALRQCLALREYMFKIGLAY